VDVFTFESVEVNWLLSELSILFWFSGSSFLSLDSNNLYIILSFIIYNGTKISLVAGIIAIIAGLSWVYSVQSFKTHFAQEASSTGGLIG